MFPIKAFVILIVVLLLVAVVVSFLNRDEIAQKKKEEQKKIEMGYIAVGDSAINMWHEDYKTVISQLEANGFTNIEEIDLEDSEERESWKDGQVESVSIAGTADFSKGELFDPKAKVVITYH